MEMEKLNNFGGAFNEQRCGFNVTLDIDLARHGKKSSFNASRIENYNETVESAEVKDLSSYDIVAVRTTPLERAVHTSLAMQEGFQKNKSLNPEKVNVRVRKLPTGVHSTDGVSIEAIMKESDESKDLNLISSSIREQYKAAVQNKEGSSWDKENAGVQVFIDLMQANLSSLNEVIGELASSGDVSGSNGEQLEKFKKFQEDEGGMSILEVVLRMIKHLSNYAEVTNRLKSNTKAYIHEVNHSGFIEPLLVYLLKKQIDADPVNPVGVTDLEKLGGGFEPNEKVRIRINREQKDRPISIKIELRGKIYIIENSDNLFEQSNKLLGLIKLHE